MRLAGRLLPASRWGSSASSASGRGRPAGSVTSASPSLDNYARALDPEFLPAVLQLAPATRCVTTVLSLVIGYPIAYWISRYGGRRKALLLILVMLPFWTSYLIRTYAWMIMLRDNGVLNSAAPGGRAHRRAVPMLLTRTSR